MAFAGMVALLILGWFALLIIITVLCVVGAVLDNMTRSKTTASVSE